MSGKVERLCANKKCDKVGVHLCSACGEEIYCSKECQKVHWPLHKDACKSAARPASAKAEKSLDALSVKQLKNVLKSKAASFDTSKRNRVLEELDRLIEKPALVKFVSQHVKYSEVESLLSSPTVEAAKAKTEEKKKTKEALKTLFPTPSPEQLKQQAAAMRANPQMVRQSNPAFAKMSDEQIRQYAETLEQAAADPAMMREIEKMSSLPPSQREKIQAIQEGVSGVRPMDDAWVDNIIDTLQSTPELFKTMLKGQGKMMGGVTDDQIASFIDLVASLPKWSLKTIFAALKFMGQSAKPIGEAYNVADKYTLGMIKYVLLAIAIYLIYYWSLATFYVLRWVFRYIVALIYGPQAAASAASQAAAAATTGVASSLSSLSAVGVVGEAAVEHVAEASGVAEVVVDAVQKAVGVAVDAELDF